MKIKSYDTKRLEGLKDFPYLETLTIDAGVLKDFKSLPNLPKLSYLRIIGSSVSSFEGLENLQRLKSLCVDVYSLDNMEGLKDCYQLSRIVIKALNLFGIEGMRDLPKLKDLHIISFDLPDTVSDLANLPTLRKLSIISRIKNVEQIKRLTQLKELSIISDNSDFYQAYQNWVRESCCNEFASEAKHGCGSDTDDDDGSEREYDSDDSEIEDDYDDTNDPHDHCGKGLSFWDFFIKKDLHRFLTNDKNCKTYEGAINDLTDGLCENNTIISLKGHRDLCVQQKACDAHGDLGLSSLFLTPPDHEVL